MASERFRKALSGAVKRAEDRQWIFGTLGRQDSDGGHTFVVPGRRGFVYVTIRQGNGAQTVVPARNDFGIEHRFNVGVRMKLEHGVYVVLGRANRADLVNTPDAPEYGVFAHATTHQHGGSDEIATLTPAPFAIPKANASGWLDDWIENAGYTQEEIEDFVAAQFVGNTGVIDATYNDTTGAITLTLDVSAADRYLYSTGADTWAEGTITSFARGLLDDADAATMRTTLGISVYDQETTEDIIGASITDGNGINATYDDGTGLVTLALTTLTSNWDIGEDRRILLEALRARDGEGILLEDDAGNVGLAVLDGGKIVIVGSDSYVLPYSTFESQGNYALVLRQPTPISGSIPIPSLLLSVNQSATNANLGSLNFMNEASSDSDKRAAQIQVTTGSTISEGYMSLRIFTEGALRDVLQLLSTGEVNVSLGSLRVNQGGASPLGNGVISINATTTSAQIGFRRNDINRWLWTMDGDAETGGNAGSNLSLWRRNDAGGSIEQTTIDISRATGNIGFGRVAHATHKVAINGSLYAPEIAAQGHLVVRHTNVGGTKVVILPAGARAMVIHYAAVSNGNYVDSGVLEMGLGLVTIGDINLTQGIWRLVLSGTGELSVIRNTGSGTATFQFLITYL